MASDSNGSASDGDACSCDGYSVLRTPSSHVSNNTCDCRMCCGRDEWAHAYPSCSDSDGSPLSDPWAPGAERRIAEEIARAELRRAGEIELRRRAEEIERLHGVILGQEGELRRRAEESERLRGVISIQEAALREMRIQSGLQSRN